MTEDFAFDMFFAGIVSMQYHPGAGTKEHKKLTTRECAEVAMEMIEVRRDLADRLRKEV